MKLTADSEWGWASSVCRYFSKSGHKRSMCTLCIHSRTIAKHIVSQRSVHGSIFAVPSTPSGALLRIFAGMLASVGALTGAVNGAFASHAANVGLLRRACSGAIGGAFLSVEILEVIVVYMERRRRILDDHDLVTHEEKLLTPAPPAIASLSTAQIADETSLSQIAEETRLSMIASNFEEELLQFLLQDQPSLEFMDSSAPEGQSSACTTRRTHVENPPSHVVSDEVAAKDAAGDAIRCDVCLKEMQQGEMAGSLEVCGHTFHMDCVDKYIV